MKGRFFMTKVYTCVICDFSAKANLVLCVKCGMWIHGRYTRTDRFALEQRIFLCY